MLGEEKKVTSYALADAKTEDSRATFEKGLAYLTGLNVQVDLKKAKKYLQKAAKDGHAEAMFNLGCMYARGEGVEKNLQKAKQLFIRAAAAGENRAKLGLGQLYFERGYYSTAIKYLKPLVELSPVAARLMGNIYFYGSTSVKRNLSLAKSYYQKAASKKDRAAPIILCVHFQKKKPEEKLVKALLKQWAADGVLFKEVDCLIAKGIMLPGDKLFNEALKLAVQCQRFCCVRRLLEKLPSLSISEKGVITDGSVKAELIRIVGHSQSDEEALNELNALYSKLGKVKYSGEQPIWLGAIRAVFLGKLKRSLEFPTPAGSAESSGGRLRFKSLPDNLPTAVCTRDRSGFWKIFGDSPPLQRAQRKK